MTAASPPDAKTRRAAFAALEALAEGDITALASDHRCAAPHPFGPLDREGAETLWRAVRDAIPDLERRDEIFLMGENRPDPRVPGPRPSPMVGALGTYLGTFTRPFLGIPPTGGVIRLTYGEGHHLAYGKIQASWLVWDLAGLMMQAGVWPLARPLGAAGHWPGPKGGHGLRLAPPAPQEPQDSLDRVLDMHGALHAFDGKSLDSMPMHHWAPDFMYWASAAIGATRGLAGFRAHHQIPFLRAFPDRRGAGHFIRVSDGPFAVTGGDVDVTHTGAPYLGVAATGKPLRFRVMDFYRFDADGLIAENWLPTDTLDLLQQMGLDVLARMRHEQGLPHQGL